MLRKKAVFKNAPQGPDTVFPVDLFAFSVSSTGIGDTDFINPAVQFGHLGGYFRFESEPLFLYIYLRYYFFFKYLVAGLHVVQVHVREHIRH